MKRLLTLLFAIVVLTPGHAAAADSVQVTGGGRGTLDGVHPFSQFGFGVSIGPGSSAQGHFTCLMAGSSAFPGFEPLMKVDGNVTSGSVDAAAGTAEFRGSGTLNLGPSGRMPAAFVVEVTEGGAGVGTLRLTVTTPDFPLPTETVLHGRITVH
jgi:hypothetical protein